MLKKIDGLNFLYDDVGNKSIIILYSHSNKHNTIIRAVIL